MPTGRVKWFDPKKGFGFIVDDFPGRGDIFVHHRDIEHPGYRTLTPDEKVAYEIEEGQKGSRARRVVRC